MGKGLTRLPAGPALVMIDTCCFIYHLQADAYPTQAPHVEELFKKIERGDLLGLTSPITIAEIMTKPRQLGLDDVVYAYKLVLLNFPNLRIPPIDATVADKASSLTARFGLKLPDALQIALGLTHGASAFVTFDRDLRRVAPLIPVVAPGE
ncbi:MAG: type II toxin-antitoxin system VapC family toxin [Patescibacteria group bacterium]